MFVKRNKVDMVPLVVRSHYSLMQGVNSPKQLCQAAVRMGYDCLALTDVDNLYARLGGNGANFCYAGHTDVVPVGDAGDWSANPFGAELRDGFLLAAVGLV